MKKEIAALLLVTSLGIMPNSHSQTESSPLIENLGTELEKSKENTDRVKMAIYSQTEWSGEIQDGNYVSHTVEGMGDKVLEISCGQTNIISVAINSGNNEDFDIYLIKEGEILEYSEDTLVFQTQGLSCFKEGVSQQSESGPYTDYSYAIIPIIIGIIIAVIILKSQKNKSELKQNGNV